MVEVERLKKAVTGQDGWVAEMAIEHPTRSGVRGTDSRIVPLRDEIKNRKD